MLPLYLITSKKSRLKSLIRHSWYMAGNWTALAYMFLCVGLGGALINVLIIYSQAKDKPVADKKSQ